MSTAILANHAVTLGIHGHITGDTWA